MGEESSLFNKFRKNI